MLSEPRQERVEHKPTLEDSEKNWPMRGKHFSENLVLGYTGHKGQVLHGPESRLSVPIEKLEEPCTW